ncbi:MAG: protein arginine kinase [Oscillospiraceae bacterium]|nr:protein arginine kinase [Oscillospiraceae bacterium]
MKNKSAKWYQKSGNQGDVVISTRVRLARNLSGVPFPSELSTERKREVAMRVRDAIKADEKSSDFDYLEMSNMAARDALSMVERHLISPEFSQCKEGSSVLLKKDESISIMINEEDHLRIQVMRPGLDLDEAYRTADSIDDYLDSRLEFAFDDRLGYLTQCPTNLGTGMRASIMLHLPALHERQAIHQLANTVSKLGLTIRGIYGEGSKPEGAIYQLSNQVTLGISEQSAMENLKGIAAQIIREERSGREQISRNPRFEDLVWRSLGILRTARLMSHDEFMSLVSNLRVGVALGIIPNIELDTLSELINDAQPATIMATARRDMEPAERDIERAKMVRSRLADTDKT